MSDYRYTVVFDGFARVYNDTLSAQIKLYTLTLSMMQLNCLSSYPVMVEYIKVDGRTKMTGNIWRIDPKKLDMFDMNLVLKNHNLVSMLLQCVDYEL